MLFAFRFSWVSNHKVRSGMTAFSARSILITGCSSGIGRCAALTLHRRGYRVFATARRPEDVAQLRSDGLTALALDLDSPQSIESALAEVLAQSEGRLYGLFNNGAYGMPGAVEDLTRDALRAQFETNLFGTHDLTRRVVPIMRAQGEGRIVQNSSLLGITAMAYRGAYIASKFALEGLTDTLRLELHGSGIHVSLIEPGPIESRFRVNAYAAYRRYIDSEASSYRDVYEKMVQRLQKPGPAAPFTLPPEAVVKRLIHALESPRPQTRYYVTVPTYAFGFLRRILSGRAMDAVLRMVSGGGAR